MATWTFKDFTTRLKKQLANDELTSVVDQLYYFLEPIHGSNEYFSNILIIKNKTTRLLKTIREDVIPYEKIEVTRMNIYNGILYLLTQLEQDGMIVEHFDARFGDYAPTAGVEKAVAIILSDDPRVTTKSIELKTELFIGRHNECDIVIQSNHISRRHAKLFVINNNRVMAMDLGSRNKTYINSKSLVSLKPEAITSDCEFALHDVIFKVRLY